MIELSPSKRGNIAADLMPDLTPLLDVMFMLIVFFILTSNAVPYALDVNLPSDAEQVVEAIEDPKVLSITLRNGENAWAINDAPYQTEQAFKDALKLKTKDNKKVMIIGDKDVSMQKLLSVMVFLRKHNIETADIVMDKQ